MRVHVAGPDWLAELEIAELVDPARNPGLRGLFLDRGPARVGGAAAAAEPEPAPGTVLLLGTPTRVQITLTPARHYVWRRSADEPPAPTPTLDSIREAVRSGELALLLAVADPAEESETAGELPRFRCLAGEIPLASPLVGDADGTRLFEDLGVTPVPLPEGESRLLAEVSVHASGLTIYGSAELPWHGDIHAPFLLTHRVHGPGFRLAVESERLTADEAERILAAWGDLASMLRPAKAPHWVTLQVADPTTAPHLYWQLGEDLVENPVLRIGGAGASPFDLLLTDRDPNDEADPPDFLARVKVDEFTIAAAPVEAEETEVDTNKLQVNVRAGNAIASEEHPNGALVYTFSETAEQLRLENGHSVRLAFHPVETPRLLRARLGLPTPEWSPDGEPVDPAVLWAFMPMQDGWAQLPVPNLTEQIYLDADLERDLDAAAKAAADASQVLEGAVSLGNEDARVQRAHPGEQPWSLTLTGLGELAGRWILERDDENSPFRMRTAEVSLIQPRFVINGLMWFSTERPTTADALPPMANWAAGLERVPIRTADPTRDLFPPLATLDLTDLLLARRSPPDGEPTSSARLEQWSCTYRIDADVFAAAQDVELDGKPVSPVLTRDAFTARLPWVWRRHARLPMIQALPLTQNQRPPNHPSASRQLAPLELGDFEGWSFGVDEGAAAGSWPRVGDEVALRPAREWPDGVDLGLVSLSLPGLVLAPDRTDEEQPRGLPPAGTLPLSQQYRYDLPYTDEINALAQVPEVPKSPERLTPDEPEEVEDDPEPLTRETFARHWWRLSEQAGLAAADAVEAFGVRGANGELPLENLIEPYVAEVRPAVDLDAYPGRLRIFAEMSGDRALAGISGTFVARAGAIELIPAEPGERPFEVTAGSMAAHTDGAGTFRDQRGLRRAATVVGPKLIETEVVLTRAAAAEERSVRLTSTRAPVELALQDGSQLWAKLWLRDVPVESGTFDRAVQRPDRSLDVNDPEALARDHNFLRGYEWRLQGSEGNALCVPLFGLEFYPLTLESVTVEDGRLASVEIVGRLQLPLDGVGEVEDITNAVRVSFSTDASAGGALVIRGVELVSDAGRWPLALESGEQGHAPRLCWRKIELKPKRDGVRIAGADGAGPEVHFVLFETDWCVELDDPLELPLASQRRDITQTIDGAPPDAALAARFLSLHLDPPARSYRASVDVHLRIGDVIRPALAAVVRFDLMATDEPPELARAVLFGVRDLGGAELIYRPGTLQLTWAVGEPMAPETPETPACLFPGMELDDAQGCPGFATATFETILAGGPAGHGLPDLRLQAAALETVLHCRWGHGLQDGAGAAGAIGSSAGSLVIGYTTELGVAAVTPAWRPVLLLNGMMEVTNLISWPRHLIAGTAEPDGDARTRHTMRVLFNQHEVPAAAFAVRSEGAQSIFELLETEPWQLLAVVEHQLVDTDVDGSRSNDRRWSTVQEVRLMRPARFRRFMDEIGPEPLLLRHRDRRTTAVDYGWFEDRLRDLLGARLDALGEAPELLIVEASAPHWIRRTPLGNGSFTTVQFLPNGTQRAVLSHPDDYAPSDHSDPQWLLLTMPFVGRLQRDGEAAIWPDPVGSGSGDDEPPDELADALTSALPEGSELPVSPMDNALCRTWARLDPTSLDENWYRVQTPPPEPAREGVSSVLAALPDTPARLSRETALRRAFDTTRPLWVGKEPAGANLIRNPEFEGGRFGRTPPVVGTIPDRWEIFKFASKFDPGTAVAAPPRGAQRERRDIPYLVIRREGSPEVDNRAIRIFSDSISTTIEFGQYVRLRAGHYRLSFEVFPEHGMKVDAAVAERARSSRVTLFAGHRESRAMNAEVVRFDEWNVVGLAFRVEADGEYRVGIRLRGEQHGCRGWRLDDPRLVRLVGDPGMQGEDGAIPRPAEPPPPVRGDRLVWRRNNVLVFDGRRRSPEAPPGWHLVAEQLRALGDNPDAKRPQRRAAATLLPVQADDLLSPQAVPCSFAISPYGALAFEAAAEPGEPRVLVAELLCASGANQELRSIATKLWELERPTANAQSGKTAPDDDERPTLSEALALSLAWARQMHRRIAPESPVAVLRYRRIGELQTGGGDGGALLSVSYSFDGSFEITLPKALSRRAVALREPVEQLRFREGQYAGPRIPKNVRPFELAPPRTVGLQPLHLPAPPPQAAPRAWPLGLSGVRVSVEYTKARRAVIGPLPPDGTAAEQRTLWWNAPHHVVQFRTTAVSRRSAGLPPLFRAPAIKSLLPVLADPPMPPSPPAGPDYQPVLPGRLRYLLVGARPGVMFAIRNQLIRQQLGAVADGEAATSVSGSVPVQHRIPRPTPLPPNVSARPADEVLFEIGEAPALRLGLALASPGNGWITADWDGTLDFGCWTEGIPPAALAEWLAVTMAIGDRAFAWTLQPQKAKAEPAEAEPVKAASFALAAADRDRLRDALGSLPAGTPLLLDVAVGHDTATAGQRQPMRFPLLLVREQRAAQPQPAQQTWASFFRPDRLAAVTASPADEAFFAAFGGSPARGLRLVLATPPQGLITEDWEGGLAFGCRAVEIPEAKIAEWVAVTMAIGEQSFAWTLESSDDGDLKFVLPESERESLQQLLRSLPPGTWLQVQVAVGHDTDTSSFRQSLRFPLLLVQEQRTRLPLRPSFVQFEDPEYNRRLASAPATSSGQVPVLMREETEEPPEPEQTTETKPTTETVQPSVTLAADRREYDLEGRVAFRFDWDVTAVTDEQERKALLATLAENLGLELARIDANGLETKLKRPEGVPDDGKLGAGTLFQFGLSDLKKLDGEPDTMTLHAGETLELRLTIGAGVTGATPPRVEREVTIVLPLRIVAEPVIPTPEAGYALLRHERSASPTASDPVSCVRFAWGPQASRVELVCADDLRAGLVRRRAVFQWVDTVRAGALRGYAVQKLTKTGSTHFPSVLTDFVGDSTSET